MTRIICPYCLKAQSLLSEGNCNACNQEIPGTYISEYKNVPPLWLVTMGFTRHGKTTYLAALTLVLEKMSRVWRGTFSLALNQYTIDKIREMRREVTSGQLADTTPKSLPIPMLYSTYSIPEYGSRCLVMYDVAGEMFDVISDVQENVASIKQVNSIWFFVSIKDVEKDEQGRSITELFQVYLFGVMRKLNINLEGRNLIVIYTKGDQLIREDRIEEYLTSDPLATLTSRQHRSSKIEFSLTEYIQDMQTMSDWLEEYTFDYVENGAAFISMVKANKMNLIFSVTSALGQSPDGDSKQMIEDAVRYRVLDPFLWAIISDKSVETRHFGLLVDTSSQSQEQLYNSRAVATIWETLSDHGDISIYHLGQQQPASKPGQVPPTSTLYPPQARLLGPILEKLHPNTRLIVMTTSPIIDLLDFHNTVWRDRLLLVVTDENNRQNWPHKITYRGDDDVHLIIETLLRL